MELNMSESKFTDIEATTEKLIDFDNVPNESRWNIGNIGISYDKLKSIFGEPTHYDATETDGKVQVEWEFTLNGMVFSIYDYKSDEPAEENTYWSVGGNDNSNYDMLMKYIFTKLNLDWEYRVENSVLEYLRSRI